MTTVSSPQGGSLGSDLSATGDNGSSAGMASDGEEETTLPQTSNDTATAALAMAIGLVALGAAGYMANDKRRQEN